MPMTSDAIEQHIKDVLPDAEVEFKDLAGDNDHWAVTIISPQFKGKNRVQQHQLVYKALGEKMGGELHALSINTKVPAE